MDTCKANVCVKNKNLIYNGGCRYILYNDFKKCPNKVYQDGFCKKCYEPDRRYKDKNWIPDECNNGYNLCQVMGKYKINLPYFSSISMYPNMNQKCPSLPPKYLRSYNC